MNEPQQSAVTHTNDDATDASEKSFRGVVIGSEWIRRYVGVNFNDVQMGVPRPRQSSGYVPDPRLVEPVMRRSLFYFDHINWPTNNFVPPDFSKYSLLEQQGLLTHHKVELTAEYVRQARAAAFADAPVFAFYELEREMPGAWSFAALGEDVPWWSDDTGPTTSLPLEEKRAIQFELFNALPVPAEGSEWADILDFRHRRRAELLATRDHLSTLYQDILKSQDVPHARLAVLDKLERSIADIARTMREGGLRGKWGTVAVDLVLDVPGGVRTGEWAMQLLGIATEYGSIAGAGLGIFRFWKKHLSSPIKRPGPLAYFERAAVENLIDLP